MFSSLVTKIAYRAVAIMPVAVFVTLTSTELATFWGCSTSATGGC